MVKVENKDTLRLLTKRFMKVNKARNIIAVIAIMLTTILFTTVFTAAFSIITSERATQTRKSLNSSHAAVQDLTKEEYEKALQAVQFDRNAARYGRGTFLGLAVNEELIAHQTEIRYGDANHAQSFNTLPTTGKMPEKEDEIACSTITLDYLGIPHKLGEKVTISLRGKDKTDTDTFRLSGYWTGDVVPIAQLIWVSEAYKEKVCVPVTRKELENGMMEGGYDITVWFKNIWNLQGKTNALNRAANIPELTEVFRANSAFLLFEEDAFSFSSLFAVLLIILCAGGLIIYNVFNISVNVDIRAYALLKNIGTTGKQLKKIVRMQALRLSIIGIPIGLLIGYAIGSAMTPSMMADISGVGGNVIVLSVNPLIFLGAVLFTLVTVYAGCFRSCRMVAKVSPVEAVKLTETKDHRLGKKKNLSVSPFGMALENVRRSFGGGLVVMVSVALSLITLNSTVMMVTGYDFNAYIETDIQSDFELNQITSDFNASNLQGISPEIKKILDSCPESERNGYLYYSNTRHRMDQVLYRNCEKNLKKIKGELNDQMAESWAKALENKEIKVHLMGMSQFIFEKLEWVGTPGSWEEFQTGNYVVIDYMHHEELPFYKKGDTLNLEYTNESQKEYQVLGTAQLAYALDYPFVDRAHMTIMVPETEYLQFADNQNAMRATLDAKDGREKAAKTYIEKNIMQNHKELRLKSILELQKAFQTYLNKYYFIGGMLAAVLALIGIMNFFNTSATSVLARKKELSLLEVVGMTKKQIRLMLAAEGCIYLTGAFVIAIAVILTASEKILTTTIAVAWFYHMKLTIVPCLITLPLLLLIAYLVPSYHYKMMSRESIVERVRNE